MVYYYHTYYYRTCYHTYWFPLTSFKLKQSYLCKRFQRTAINGPFSNWNEIMTGVLQGSILESMLFKIFLNDKFLFITNRKLCNYTDSNTLHCTGKNLSEV